MRKGVINVVEVLVLIVIFLAAAAFLASFYMTSVTQQSEKIKEESQKNVFLINPPAKVIGTVVVENYTNSESEANGQKDAVPFACLEEVGSGKSWWLSSVYLIKGYGGNVFKSVSLYDVVKTVSEVSNLGDGSKQNFTEVAFGNLNKLVALCYLNDTLNAVYKFDVSCDEEVLKKTVNDAVGWCKSKANAQTTWMVKFLNPFQYLPSGGVGVAVGPIIPGEVVQQGGTFSFKVKLAESYDPNPLLPYSLKQEGSLTFDDIVSWIQKGNGAVSAVGVIEAVCESCTFSVG
ncbi:hypothetical protein [Ignicoccus hospitalis]|uniref:Uncharacterized protein n=1 Tax=Ignicoccus hospitalis (strain KIN4/I / DSM 18386 / JCM 14125) TaxID=453591 RepID=A8A910_IGNH4|nr:hypothetical protein [Ignicoccus hospitalis]ABU81412.1 hypothetical protein Igni_0228 [Ignicoccus hospitalis KIN4/I]HIH90281.1 hypothetical protein [Desulfurococcaceae archaeon]